MGHIDLARDPGTRLFTVSAMAQKLPTALTAKLANPFVQFEMFMDTGSNGTAISEDVAVELGYSLPGLARRGSGGIGLPTSLPIVPDFQFYVLETGGPVTIKLPQVTVIENHERKDKKLSGPLVKTRTMRQVGVSLLGLDSMEYLHAKLEVRPNANIATLDW